MTSENGTTPSKMTRMEASRLLGERDGMPTAERKRIKRATHAGRRLGDPRERDLQRAMLLEERGSRRLTAITLVLGPLFMLVSLVTTVADGESFGLRDALAVIVLALAPFVFWQLWRQRSLERQLGRTPETDLT
ncbi:hypothetical protein FV141_12445 [Dermacoccus abyssi]|uniref:DUF3040 domain-containing protein n=1 Tax=Dermacoccus abyssi TaxID=322596 RepID=A0ABX5ZBY7_9MICO|nr:hypothetical protein FV141_12445 [Dermacoccus abyssi]